MAFYKQAQAVLDHLAESVEQETLETWPGYGETHPHHSVNYLHRALQPVQVELEKLGKQEGDISQDTLSAVYRYARMTMPPLQEGSTRFSDEQRIGWDRFTHQYHLQLGGEYLKVIGKYGTRTQPVFARPVTQR